MSFNPFEYGAEALAKEPNLYQLYIDNEKMGLLDFYNRLMKGPYDFLSVSARHKDEMDVTIYRYDLNSTQWYLNLSYPGARYHLTRSFGTQHLSIPADETFAIWEILESELPGLHQALINRQVYEHTRKEMYSKAAEAMAEEGGLPENMGIEIASFIEGPRRPGWARGKANLKKINTTLFTNGEVNMPRHLKKVNTTLFSNGGKRKTRTFKKTRKQRKERASK